MDDQYQKKIDSDESGSRTSRYLNALQTTDLSGVQVRFSPWRFLLITIGGIFLVEVAAMAVIYGLPHLPYYLQTLIDASLMVLLIFPVVYFFSLRPLVLHINKHQQMEKALRHSEERYALAYRSNPAALSITCVEDECFIEVNESFLRLSGYAHDEVLGRTSDELNLYPNPEDRDKLKWLFLKQGSVDGFEMTIRPKSGEIRNISISAEVIEIDGEANILTIASDITERKQAEEHLRQVNHGLSVLKECNKILVHAESETELVQQMCEIIVNIGEYRMACVGFAEQDRDRSVRLAAQAGFEDGYLDLVKITWADDEFGRGPTGTAIREGVTQVNQNFQTNLKTEPWRASALSRGYQSSIALPLKDEGCTIGALMIYSASPDAFDEDEVNLLNELAADMAFGISALRVRAERREVEKQLHIQTKALESAANGVIVTSKDGRIFWANQAFASMSGYSVEEVLGKLPSFLNSGVHDLEFHKRMWATILSGNVWRGEVTNRRRDGTHYINDQTITPVFNSFGEIENFIAIQQDITDRKQAEQDIKEREQKEFKLIKTIRTMQVDIARDLHDTIGQNISYLRMKLDSMADNGLCEDPVVALDIKRMSEVANESYDLIRGTLAVLQSENSTDLSHLFARYAAQVGERSAFEVDFSSQGEARSLSAKRMRQLFYVFREVLNNIEKHAKASRISIEMSWGDQFSLVVFDNGRGFDTISNVQSGAHYGLKFMKDRVEMLDGTLAIKSEPGAGTNIIIHVPYEND